MAKFDPHSEIERVTHKPRLLSLLQRIIDARAVVSVHFPDHNQLYNSALLSLSPKSGEMVLDELTPQRGHEKLLSIGSLHATARLGGVNIRFRTDLKRATEENGIASYIVNIPTAVLYEQRRNAFRVLVSKNVEIPIFITTEDEVQHEGLLADISSTGIGAYIDKEVKLEKNGKLYHCKIDLPNGAFIAGQLEMRFLRVDEKLDKLQLGGQFVSLTGPQRNTLDRLVMTLQREAIKRAKNTA